jgi:hypothetical protein
MVSRSPGNRHPAAAVHSRLPRERILERVRSARPGRILETGLGHKKEALAACRQFCQPCQGNACAAGKSGISARSF